MEIMKGWEAFSLEGKTDIGVLVSQGFTGSTSSVRFWAEKLAEAGYHVESPRLSGHGTRWQDVNQVSWRDWVNDEEEAFAKLSRKASKIFVAGLSFGGAMALYLAERHPEVKGILCVNNAIRVDSPLLPLLPVLRYLIPSVPAISNDIKDPSEKEVAYDRTPVGGVVEMSRLLGIIRKDLPKIVQPLLVFKSRQDHVLPAHNATIVMDRVSSKDKELVWLENSYHVATQDYDKDIIVRRSIEFIQKHN